MSDIQLLIAETAETICDHFCKYSGTGDNDNGCVYSQTHAGECPFDALLKEIGNVSIRE